MLSKENKEPNFETIKHSTIQTGKSGLIICRILKDVITATDESGIKSIKREKGKVYPLFSSLANNLINAGLAEKVNPVMPEETKSTPRMVISQQIIKEEALIEKAKELIKPGIKNIDIAEKLGITLDELKELKKQIK